MVSVGSSLIMSLDEMNVVYIIIITSISRSWTRSSYLRLTRRMSGAA